MAQVFIARVAINFIANENGMALLQRHNHHHNPPTTLIGILMKIALHKTTLSLAAAITLALYALPALADSTSSASSAASTSVGSSSTSLETSSNSSTGKKQVAQGAYTLVDMVAVADKPELMRLRLQANATALTPEFFLLVPRLVVQQAQLAAGQTVQAEQRAYGMAFSATGSTPFFLVLDDAVHRELESRPVTI